MKIKTTGFWISLCSAIILVCQTIANAFGLKFDAEYVNEIVTSICGVLVVVGVLIPTKNKESEQLFDTKDVVSDTLTENVKNDVLDEFLEVNSVNDSNKLNSDKNSNSKE